jgi:hypothetical protein
MKRIRLSIIAKHRRGNCACDILNQCMLRPCEVAEMPLTRRKFIPYTRVSGSNPNYFFFNLTSLAGNSITSKISRKEMASMATRNQWFCMTRLRDITAASHGHAMPISLIVLGYRDGIVVFDSPVTFGTRGCSVPIPVDSPPTP